MAISGITWNSRKQIPKTIENTRAHDETMVQEGDIEVGGDERDDEFAKFFGNESKPKILITTRPRCSKKIFPLISDLMQMIPNAFYYPREKHLVRDMIEFANGRNFTHLVILGEKAKVCNGLLVTQLKTGPTAYFKVYFLSYAYHNSH